MTIKIERAHRRMLLTLFVSGIVVFAFQTARFERVTHADDPPRLNEVEVNTPSGVTERCEYAEIIGTPGAMVSANTFFLSIDGDPGQFGTVNYIKNLGGVTFGSNGMITIINGQGLNCPNRTYPAGTTVVTTTSVAMGFGAETFVLVSTTQPAMLFEGQDLDGDDDGNIDSAFMVTPIDGFGWTLNENFNKVYGGVPNLTATLELTDVPDAAT